jgi:hypothetical protein
MNQLREIDKQFIEKNAKASVANILRKHGVTDHNAFEAVVDAYIKGATDILQYLAQGYENK